MLLVVVFFGASIGYSRVILGVHSWNQVVFGWSLGLWIAFTLHFCVKDYTVEAIWNLLQGELVGLESQALKSMGLLAVLLAIQIGNYQIMDSLITNE